MKKPAIKALACTLAAAIPFALAAGAAKADSYSVNLLSGGYNYPYHTYSAPYQYPPPIGTGGNQLLPMFNPTTGFLTQVDMSFSYSTGYSGVVSNSTAYNVPEAWFQDTGSKMASFIFTPVGTLWSHTPPSEGRTESYYLGPYRSSWYIDSPMRSYGSGVYSITDPEDVSLFVGIGNDNSLIQAHIRSNYNLVTSSAAIRVANWMRSFYPRGTITYHYNPFPADPIDADGGLSFAVAQGPGYGQGQVEPTPLGASHKHMVQAFPGQAAVNENTGLVQRFQFWREDQGTQQTEVFINGLLDGFVSADENGVATALGVMELYNADDQLIDRAERIAVADSQTYFGRLEERDVHELFGMTVMLLPGNVYELRSELHLTADPRGEGRATADFSSTFNVELSGVPEPASLGLLVVGGLALLRRRRRA
ncbi:MAG: PEP-CTERM sorting domain-containing protein [Phycisphaerae bacterium]